MASRFPAQDVPPVPSLDQADELRSRFAELEEKSKARAIAIALDDLETGAQFHYHADRWFHAASTIKLAILVGVYGAIYRGDLLPQSRVHVRNRFLSAYDGSPYRVSVDRDANSQVHREIGRTLRVSELAEHMIASRWLNGSSISRMSGSIASARVIATRCCMPPDRLSG